MLVGSCGTRSLNQQIDKTKEVEWESNISCQKQFFSGERTSFWDHNATSRNISRDEIFQGWNSTLFVLDLTFHLEILWFCWISAQIVYLFYFILLRREGMNTDNKVNRHPAIVITYLWKEVYPQCASLWQN